MKRDPWYRRKRLLIGAFVAVVFAVTFIAGCQMTHMPGHSHQGPLPPITAEQQSLAARLRTHVEALAVTIGPRSMDVPDKLEAAARYIEGAFTELGYTPVAHAYSVAGQTVRNIEVEIPGTARRGEIVVIGAHYDSAYDTPAANDNASGVAAMIEIARAAAAFKPERTLRFVAFVNEEPPYFQSDNMGSRVYARRCRERKENIVAMFSLETIGYYTDAPNSQHYPAPLGMLYPSTGNFVAFVGNWSSRALVRSAVGRFRERGAFPSEGAALPGSLPGVGWSDHWSFWQEGYPAVMITDTAPFRYPYYHTAHDTPDKIDFDRTARVVEGFANVLGLFGRGD